MWIDAHEAEFTDLKDALLSPDTMLYHPDKNSPFELHTDASKHCIGAMFAQWHNGKLRPVKFFSRLFTAVEGRWPTTHEELFAVKHSLEHFRPYLLGHKLTVITDHAYLQWLTSISLSCPNLHAGVFLWQSLVLKLNIVLVLPMSFRMYLVALP